MKYPPRVQQIINALWAQHQDLARGDDDQRRALTLMIAQQCRFELGESWGTKSADSGRPPSKDAIAQQQGATLWGWDTINGTTREPNMFPDGEDITGQHFIAVQPVDHLGGTEIPPPPQPPQPPTECHCDMGPLTAAVGHLEEAVARLAAKCEVVQLGVDDALKQLEVARQQLDEIKQRQDRAFTGRIFGVQFTLDVRK